MALIDNISNVAFASSYSTDKIVGIYTGSFAPNTAVTTTLGGYLYQYAIPHSFTRPVFTELIWSPDNTTFVDGGSGSVAGNSTIAYSDSSNIYVTTTQSSGTIYYKVVAIWIDDYDTTNPSITPVLNTTQTRVFDSTANYQKVVLSGSYTKVPGSGSVANNLTFNYGFIPNAKVYFESLPGQVWPAISGGVSDVFLYDFASQWEVINAINATSMSTIGSYGASSSSARFWYRVYGDTQ